MGGWLLGAVAAVALAADPGFGQVIEFESNGLRYQTLTRNGVTVMFARMPTVVREYAILQTAIANGSGGSCAVRPEDFVFHRIDGSTVRGAPARLVVDELIEKGGRGDVVKLVSAYEASLYGMDRIRSTNGYEQRRQAALAEVHSTKIKAAAAASAIVLVATRLRAGESTDGAVFFPNAGRPLGSGKLVVQNAGGEFVFPVD